MQTKACYIIETNDCSYGGFTSLESAKEFFKKDKDAVRIVKVTELKEIIYETNKVTDGEI